MNIAAIDLAHLIAKHETLVCRFAGRAIVAAIGQDRANDAASSMTDADIDAAIAALESPSFEDHKANAALFGADPEASYMAEVHAVNTATSVLNTMRKFA